MALKNVGDPYKKSRDEIGIHLAAMLLMSNRIWNHMGHSPWVSVNFSGNEA
jgi:hypothetical protein